MYFFTPFGIFFSKPVLQKLGFMRGLEDVLAEQRWNWKTVKVALVLPCKVWTKKAKFCIISIRLSLILLICKRIAIIKGMGNTTEAWKTESEKVEGPEKGYSRPASFADLLTKSLILLFWY